MKKFYFAKTGVAPELGVVLFLQRLFFVVAQNLGSRRYDRMAG
ncbi:hypothetical protein [Terriglobus albidus]|nr:hypothetical protein [Terriglobus albidus]